MPPLLAAPQDLLLLEDFETLSTSTLTSLAGWSTAGPSAAQIVPTTLPGWGNQALRISGDFPGSFNAPLAQSPLGWPPTTGRLMFDAVLDGTGREFDVMFDAAPIGGTAVQLRFDDGGLITLNQSIGPGLFNQVNTTGSWQPGTPTRIEIYASWRELVTIVQDGEVIYANGDLVHSTVAGFAGLGAFSFGTPGGTGSNTLTVDNVRFERCAPLPSEVCTPAAPNSAYPEGAMVSALGSQYLRDQLLTLSVFRAAPGQAGLWFYGDPLAAPTPLANGQLCAGGNIVRVTGPVMTTPPNLPFTGGGNHTHFANFASPQMAGLQAGQTYVFQFWYRDPQAGGGNANLSNGLSITFCP